jgi:DNA-binding MarR family transcriptional regulator
MEAEENNRQLVTTDLLWAIRKFTRSSLLLQQVIAEEIGLYATDAECMDFLMEMGPSPAGDLARAMRLTTGAVTNVIDRLEKKGFVERRKHPTDRRKVIVHFLPKNNAKAKLRYDALVKDISELFTRYNPTQLQFLAEFTSALTAIYQENTLAVTGGEG